MCNVLRQTFAIVLTFIFLLLLQNSAAFAQQTIDPTFQTNLRKPTYINRHPTVLYDEAHFNLQASGGNYKPFLDLITKDGYQVKLNKRKFSAQRLKGSDILIITNALGAKGLEAFNRSAFTERECNAVREWVQEGGALLLIADHAPYGTASNMLSQQFGVRMSGGFAIDTSKYNHDKDTDNTGYLVFTRYNGLLSDHPITLGRDSNERIKRVISFAGQPLVAPNMSQRVLELGSTSINIPSPSVAEIKAALASGTKPLNQLPSGAKLPLSAASLPGLSLNKTTSAAGLSQAVALKLGKGRVVILGEAGLLSAQLVQVQGEKPIKVGMNRTDFDNKQFALNIMHWLSKYLNYCL